MESRGNGKPTRRVMLLVTSLFATLLTTGVAFASMPGQASGITAIAPAQVKVKGPADIGDGLESLPIGMQGVSYSTLLQMGKVHPSDAPVQYDPTAHYDNPSSVITWGSDINTSGGSSANEPSASLHPTNPLFALVSGNFTIDNTSNGGTTWQSRNPANPSGNGDVVNAWLPNSPGQNYAYNASLDTQHGANITSGRSTDRGVTWQNFPSNIDTPTYFNDREYLFSDQEPSSPFYGRIYLTGTFFDQGGSGSFNTTWNRWSSDGGATWSPPFLNDNTNPISGTQGNKQFASIGFGQNGSVNVGWMDARCCGASPTAGNFNKYKWSRSTDGGVTFPISGTAATDTQARSIPFNSTGPGGFRWSPMTNMAADPVDGTMYMVWLARRVDNNNTGSAVFITHSTNGGTNWTAPIPVYNNPSATVTQYFPWATVSRDHVLHVTFTSSVGASQTTLAHFYVQSTDQGNTFTAPFQLSSVTYPAASFMGDYAAIHAGGYSGTSGAIVASWTDTRSGSAHHYARIGTFQTTCLQPDYQLQSSDGAAIVPGTTYVAGSTCNSCAVSITLPFAYTLYDQTFTSVSASNKGNLQFASTSADGNNVCLPASALNYAIMPYWDDLNTNINDTMGIYTSVSGTAPNRIFNIEWRAGFISNDVAPNFEVRLYEGQPRFEFIYGTTRGGFSATVGVQKGTGSQFTQYSCDTNGTIIPGRKLVFDRRVCLGTGNK